MLQVVYGDATLKVLDPKLDGFEHNVFKKFNIQVNINMSYQKHVKPHIWSDKKNISFCSVVYEDVLMRFLSIEIFDTRLDHDENNVIKSVDIKVNINKSYGKHVKPQYDQIKKNTSFCSVFYGDVNISRVLIQNLIILNSVNKKINIKVNINTSHRKHFKQLTHMTRKIVILYMEILIRFLSIKVFLISKTGSWCDQDCQYQTQHKYFILETC